MENAVVISGLNKRYSNGRGIMDINLSIKQGEIVGVLGPNGAGKTTLLKCMTGLVLPDNGEVEIFGFHLQRQYKDAIRSVGALIGPAVAYENMTPYQNLKMISRFYSVVSNSRIEEVLEQTGLSSFKNEKISSFSMGMKQRFGIASALISEPRLIILDEPTNGLDIDGLLMLRKIIQEIATMSGVTFVISSHHISELEKICNRFCFLINGKASVYEPSSQTLEEIYIQKIREKSL
ncbi:ABC transporter ATP-binding protein [Bacillus sp. MRMR6]|uniref:ABC transporter ATP-binding protein n=1 Tax=Bacillus sp. MRMR6 TaxID=1928617 RepID=UPI000950FFE6|nr:ABC transporter ATP-binding protein [Bacillus sp. MRMR6]OLS41866.1 ABC transporter [Bacillus sp. MRMR6]